MPPKKATAGGASSVTSKVLALMNGVDTMSKAELIFAIEKHKIDCPTRVIKDMKYLLKRYYEEHPDDDDDAPPTKKAKVDSGAAASPTTVATAAGGAAHPGVVPAAPAVKPGFCPLGEKCPDLYSMSHRTALQHDGYRGTPIRCRDGMGCSQLKDLEHLVKYAHVDDLSKVCKDGADCSLLHLMSHRCQYEHPGYRAQPVRCRDGMSCAMLKDKPHLYKYAHDDGGAAAPPTSPSKPVSELSTLKPSASSDSSGGLSVKPSTVSSEGSSVAAKLIAVAGDEPPPPPTSHHVVVPHLHPHPKSEETANGGGKGTSSAAGGGNGFKYKVDGKVLADVPLESAPESVLVPVDTESEEFWDIEERFAANLQGRNEDYVAKRIKAGKKPLRFILTGAEKVVNPVLEERFEIKKAELLKLRESKDCRERVSFHGTHPKNVKSILRYSLLRFKHPLNPCKTQVDDGYFGTNRKGIYVSRYADYTLKYSNRVTPVDEGDEVKTIMFRTLPGKSMHIEKLCGAIDPTPGYDSHSSPTFLEWYLFDEAQVCPQYVLKVKAVVDTRTAADDE